MNKQDRQGVRTPAQLEQKYRLGERLSLAESERQKHADAIVQMSLTLAQILASTNLEGKVTGSKVILKDISPIEHTLTVKLLSAEEIDFTAVTVSKYGKSEADGILTYTPNEEGVVDGVTSLYPITTLITDTEGVVIEVTYSKDLNKAI